MKKRPNIIFLMSDQHRWDALGCINPLVKTPNLDALASSGIIFREAVCNVPMCVPSRYSMMLGLYGSQCGVRHNTQFIPVDEKLPLPMLPQRLLELGYQTAGFGKTHWYLGERYQPEDVKVKTSRRGFEVKAQARPLDPSIMQPGALNMQEDSPEAFAKLAGETRPFGGGGENIHGFKGITSGVPGDEHREGWLTGKCLDFLDSGRDSSRPLFLYLSFDFPHAGFNVPEGYEKLYDINEIPDRKIPPWKDNIPEEHSRPDMRIEGWSELSSEERRLSILRYYALCSYIDGMFGKVLSKLKAMGELENSLIIFTSDHGEMLGDRCGQFKKYCLYDGSVRVPLILAGSVIPRGKTGTVDERPAELVDILPTFVESAGGGSLSSLPGRSLLKAPCRIGAFAEMHGTGYETMEPISGKNWREGTPVQAAPTYMWRTKEWKLILHIPGNINDAMNRINETRGELYNLKADPGEWTNLYGETDYFGIRESMTRQLLMHLACVWARYPWQPARAKTG